MHCLSRSVNSLVIYLGNKKLQIKNAGQGSKWCGFGATFRFHGFSLRARCHDVDAGTANALKSGHLPERFQMQKRSETVEFTTRAPARRDVNQSKQLILTIDQQTPHASLQPRLSGVTRYEILFGFSSRTSMPQREAQDSQLRSQDSPVLYGDGKQTFVNAKAKMIPNCVLKHIFPHYIYKHIIVDKKR